MFQPQFCLLHFASIPTFFACRTASFLVFYIPPKKYIWDRRLFKKRKLNPLSSSQLISSTPACDLAMLPPKLGSRNSGCQRLRCRVASSRTPGSSTAGAAGAAGAAAGAFVGAGTWENAAEIHGFAIVSGQPFVGQLIWRFACYNHDVRWLLSSLSVCILPSGTPTWKWGSSDCPGRDLEGSDCWLVLGLYLIHFTGI